MRRPSPCNRAFYKDDFATILATRDSFLFLGCKVFRPDKAIVLFCCYFDSFFGLRKLEQRDQTILDKLGGDRATNQASELIGAHGPILFYLDNSDSVPVAFCLHRQHIMRAALIDSYVNLIGFNLGTAL